MTNLARPGIMCPFHESSRRSDGSVLDDGKDDQKEMSVDSLGPEIQSDMKNIFITQEIHGKSTGNTYHFY